MYFGHLVPHHIVGLDVWKTLVGHVNDPSALFAIEVGMGGGHAVIANSVVIDGQHSGSLLFGEKAQRVVNGCDTQCGYLIQNALVDFFHRGVGVMW